MASTLEPTAAPACAPRTASRWLSTLYHCVLDHDPEYQRQLCVAPSTRGLSDMVVGAWPEPCEPPEVFWRLRWGGQFVYASPKWEQAQEQASRFAAAGYLLQPEPTWTRGTFLGMRIPGIGRKTHYFAARKMMLLPPGDVTDRFTYNVRLVQHPDPDEPFIVLKEVPTIDLLLKRLIPRFPELPLEALEQRARKFIDKIFPTFLTREAAFLKILQEHLPAPYCHRVPRCIKVEKDDRGFVRKLWMSWLRNGGKPISQMEFAHQSADLLRVLHDVARVIHLDLRLDNFVITPRGVGFVDFGSAVRVDEKLEQNPLLDNLFGELMRTSQIQIMLNDMTLSGHVTSDIICRSRHRIDKAVDFFYLAVQFNCPHANADLADLIEYDPNSKDARHLARLTAEILRPSDPANPAFRSARDILHAIERIRLKLGR